VKYAGRIGCSGTEAFKTAGAVGVIAVDPASATSMESVQIETLLFDPECWWQGGTFPFSHRADTHVAVHPAAAVTSASINATAWKRTHLISTSLYREALSFHL
jgi:hypothetical protein